MFLSNCFLKKQLTSFTLLISLRFLTGRKYTFHFIFTKLFSKFFSISFSAFFRKGAKIPTASFQKASGCCAVIVCLLIAVAAIFFGTGGYTFCMALLLPFNGSFCYDGSERVGSFVSCLKSLLRLWKNVVSFRLGSANIKRVFNSPNTSATIFIAVCWNPLPARVWAAKKITLITAAVVIL